MTKKTIETSRGLSGLLRLFKSTMVGRLGLQSGHRVAFIGCVGTCVPFVELFAYAIRDVRPGMILVPDGIIDDARSIWYVDGVGMQVGGAVDPWGADFVVVLGGISMPSCSLGVDGTNRVIGGIMKPDGRVIGVCFMDMFAKAGWEDKVPFDVIINANIDSVTLDSVDRA
ncbi:MAG TPA: DUF2124 family protein [Methanocella sp.]|nr:DUF2124 family protein [Methanocella sp.]